MSVLDIVIALFILIGLWQGFKAGFVRTSVALVSWFIALVAGTHFADDMAPYLSGFITNPVLQMGLGFLIIVLAVLLSMQIVSTIVRSIVEGLKLGFIDQMAGGLLGSAKNVLIVLVILSVTAPVLVELTFWQNSVLAPALMDYAPFAQDFVVEVLGSAWQQVNDIN